MSVPSPSEVSDIVQRARAGEDAAFVELVRRYQGLVYATCFEQAGRAAEDLTQEVFLAAYRHLDTLEEPQKLAAWLRGIAKNLSKMHLRSSPRESFTNDTDTGPDETNDTSRKLELQQLLADALANVSEQHREVLSLHYLGGYSYAEIATLCSLPSPLVKSRLHEGRAQLKTRLMKLAASLCHCSMNAEQTAQRVMERCGTEQCQCASQLLSQ